MRISSPIEPRDRHGYALLITLVFLAITLVSLASMMWWASSNGKVTQQNELFTTAEAAADAGAEKVVSQLDRDWTYSQTLQATSVYSALVPVTTNWGMSLQFSDGSGTVNKTGVTIGTSYYTNALGSEFANLSGYVQPCTIISTATLQGQLYTVPATVKEVVNATIIPLFQFAIFYNMNLEIDPGSTMTVNGPVFSNQGIWAGTANVTFNSTVASAGYVYDRATDTTNDDPWASGKGDPGTPSGNFPVGMPINGEDSLTLPIGVNTTNTPSAVEAIINLPPGTNGAPNASAYTTNGQSYLFNESDLIISNAANGLAGPRTSTNITIWYQDPNNPTSYLTPVTNDFYAFKTNGGSGPAWTNVLLNTNGIDSATNVAYTGYSFVTNVSYYDFRESNTVQAVQIDVSKLNVWLTNTASTGGNTINRTSFSDNGHGIRSIYVYNSASNTATQMPAVRLVNGQQLPFTTDPGGSGATTSGLTVTTPQPIYVKGNYNVQTASSSPNQSAGTTNTAYTYPAAILADALTILSTNWNDTGNAYTNSGSYTSRTPVSTTVNAAALEGIVQSTNSSYSGGVENFLRLEENWGNTTPLTYNGSIVVMFPSIYATNPWQAPSTASSYYGVPTRSWAFDLNFTVPSKLPPLTPKVYRMIRSTWTDY
jgi:hypothetical protein